MKAPTRLHRALVSKGFGYLGGDYVGRAGAVPLTKRLRIDHRVHKNDEIDAYSIDVTVAYPFYEIDAGIVPYEVGCIRSDGKAWYVPSRDERDLYIAASELESLVLSEDSGAMGWLRRFCDAEIMLQLIEYLSGESEESAPFTYLATDPYIKRRPTASLVSSKVAYLNVAGRYDEAIEALKSPILERWCDGEFQRKLRNDAMVRSVDISEVYLEKLRSSGVLC